MTRRPLLLAAYAGVSAGWGAYAVMRILGERVFFNTLVPTFMLIPLFGMALAPILRRHSLLLKPGVLLAAFLAMTGAIAMAAHAYYLPWSNVFPPIPRRVDHRHGVALLVLLVASPFPFLALGRALADAFTAAPNAARAAAVETGAFCAGSALAYLAVTRVGGYEAFLSFLVLAGARALGRKGLVALVLACAVAGVYTRVKPPSFFTWSLTSYQWEKRHWSANQKLDAVRFEDCSAYMYNNFLFFYNCPGRGRELFDVLALSTELGKRLPVRTIVNIGAAAGLTPLTLLRAYPRVETYYAVEIEGKILEWGAEAYREQGGAIFHDPRVIRVPEEGRRFLERSGLQADFIFLDGVDTPFLAESMLPALRGAWFFTREGYRAIFDRLSPEGYLIIEAGGNKPEHIEGLLRAAPEDAKVAIAWYANTTFPMVGMPHFWIALTKSEKTHSAIQEAFASVANVSVMEPPPIGRRPVPTDDRPLLFTFPAPLFVAVASLPVLVIVGILLGLRRRLGVLGPARLPMFLLLGAGGAGLQIVTVASYSRGYAAPATGYVVLLCSSLIGGMIGSSLASAMGGKGRRSVRVGAALAAAIAAGAVYIIVRGRWNPFMDPAWSWAPAMAAAVPSGCLWGLALLETASEKRPAALGADLAGAVAAGGLSIATLGSFGYLNLFSASAACILAGGMLLVGVSLDDGRQGDKGDRAGGAESPGRHDDPLPLKE